MERFGVSDLSVSNRNFTRATLPSGYHRLSPPHRELFQLPLREVRGGTQEPHPTIREVHDGRGFAAPGLSLDDQVDLLRHPRVHLFKPLRGGLAREIRAR